VLFWDLDKGGGDGPMTTVPEAFTSREEVRCGESFSGQVEVGGGMSCYRNEGFKRMELAY
jgi:hypothetical protein